MEGRLTAESFALVKNIHINWYIHAIKALMGQVGRQLYEKLTAGEKIKRNRKVAKLIPKIYWYLLASFERSELQ